MPNIPLTLLLHFGVLFAGIAVLRLFGRRTAIVPLLLGLGVVVMYWLVSPLGFWLQGQLPIVSALRWNWLGKVAAIAGALIYWRLTHLSRNEIGLTWRQRAGSLVPALVVVALLCAFSWTNEARAADGTSLSAGRLLFQAIMPGLDEELVFRGLLLAFFVRAFGVGREIADGSFGWAGVAVTFLFAAGHGLFVADGTVTMNWHAFFVTGTIGGGLLWLRTRTGSLALPLVAHNAINFGNSFF